MVKFEANLLVLTRYILAIFSCLRAGIKRTTGFNYGGFFFFTDKCTLRKEDSESKRVVTAWDMEPRPHKGWVATEEGLGRSTRDR